MSKLWGTEWPHSSPASSQSGGRKGGGDDRPQVAGRAAVAVRGPRDRGQHTSAPYSPRAGAARHSQSASSAHSGAGRRAGIFSVASSAASACADPHEEGVPTEDPPLSFPPPASAAHGLELCPEAQAKVSPLPAPQVCRSRAAASAAARSLAETFSAVQRSSLVCPSASAASSHRKPRPPVATAGPRRLRHPGVSRRKKRRPELRAEGSTTSPPIAPPSLLQPASDLDAP